MGPTRPNARRLAIVSAVRLYREGLQELLRSYSSVEVVAVYPDLAALLSEWGAAGCQAVLVDASAIQYRNRIEALRRAVPGVRVIAIATESDDASLMGYATAGVDAVIDPEGTVESLIHIVTSEFRSHSRMPAQAPMAEPLAADPVPNGNALTDRELEIVGYIDAGLTNKEIAQHLGLSPATVKNHVHNLLTKLGVARRGAAAAHVRKRPRFPE